VPEVAKVFNIRLKLRFYDALFRIAALEGCPKSVVIRRLIRDEALRLGVWEKGKDA